VKIGTKSPNRQLTSPVLVGWD